MYCENCSAGLFQVLHQQQSGEVQLARPEPEEEGQVKEKVVGASEKDVIFNFWVSLS